MNKPASHILLIIVLGLLAYSNTFSVPFHFDDTLNIVENPIVKDLHYFTDPSSASGFQLYDTFKGRFIGYLSFALNYQLHGLDVTGYHIVNLAIHVINALLVYWLVILTFSTPYFASRQNSAPRPEINSRPANPIALFSALLFVSHPVQTQAVTYIVQRFASLATLFYLLSLVLYIKWRALFFRTPGTDYPTRLSPSASRLTSAFWYLAALFSAVLAMKTKEIAFTLPVMIALYEFMFFEGTIKKRVPWLVPILLTMLIIPLSLISIDKPIGDIISDVGEATRLQSALSRWDYLFTQFRVIVTYIRLIFLPINQNLDYDYPVSHSFFEPAAFLSFLFLFSIFGLGVYLLYRSRSTSPLSRFLAFGIFWFFIALAVESSIIPIADVIFEHRLYLSSLGMFIAIISAAFLIFGGLTNKWPNVEKIFITVLSVIIITLTGSAYARNIVWKDESSLWADVVKKSPNNARGHNNLGAAYQSNGHFDSAIEQYQIALRLKPEYADARKNLGIAYQSDGRVDSAIKQYQISLSLRPDDTEVHNNLGVAYRSKGLLDMAIEQYKTAISLKPEYPEAHNNLGYVYHFKGLLDMAIEQYQTALSLKPDYAKAHINLGYAYHSKGLLGKAIEQYQIALNTVPNDADIHFKLGMAYFKNGDIDMARKEFKLTLRIKPDHNEAREALKHITSKRR